MQPANKLPNSRETRAGRVPAIAVRRDRLGCFHSTMDPGLVELLDSTLALLAPEASAMCDRERMCRELREIGIFRVCRRYSVQHAAYGDASGL